MHIVNQDRTQKFVTTTVCKVINDASLGLRCIMLRISATFEVVKMTLFLKISFVSSISTCKSSIKIDVYVNKTNQRGDLIDKTFKLSVGISQVRIPGRGKCSPRTIAVDARVKQPLKKKTRPDVFIVLFKFWTAPYQKKKE